jgi:endonuclease/exonuclease/phosphatase family metal-dependent hydrolase
MRLATFNVENMFDRAKAMNSKTWADGKPALEAHSKLNALFNKVAYSSSDKKRMLELLAAQGLERDDDGPFLILRRIRGTFLKRPKTGAVTVEATGRGDWVGWVELKTEHVDARATENTARVMQAVNADILGVVEAEDRTSLQRFNAQMMVRVGAEKYEHVMLVDGNDDRGIDVGLLTRGDFPIRSICSHVYDADGGGVIVSRDCAEYEIGLPGGQTLLVMVNHLKSKGYGSPAENDAKRLRQAARIRKIVDERIAAGRDLIAVIGDLNEIPGGAPLQPLLAQGSKLKDIADFPAIDNGGRRGTHGNCTDSGKLDYILLSPRLFQKVTAAGIERRGMWGGTKGTLWPHFPEVENASHAASDHAALWVDLAL